MRQRATWVLLPLFLLAIGALWWSEYAKIPTVAEKRRLMNRVLPELIDLKRSEVQRVEIQRPKGKQSLAFVKRDDGGWQLKQPIDAAADRGKVETLIENLVKLAKSPESGTIEEDPAKYKLDDSSSQIRIYVKSATEPIATLDVGGTIRNLRAVRAKGSTGIDLVPAEGLAVIDSRAADLRDRGILTFASSKVEKVKVIDREPARNLSLARDERTWRMSEPVKTRADAEKVEALIAELGVLEVVEGESGFVAADVKPADLPKYGLNPPRMTIVVEPFSSGGSRPVKVALGDSIAGNNDRIYALQDGQDDVVLVDIKRLREAMPKPSSLRSPEAIEFDPAKVARIQVDIPGLRFLLEKRAIGWEQVEPIKDLAEPTVVAQLLKGLREMKALAFLGPTEVLDPKVDAGSSRFQLFGAESTSPALVDLKLGRLDSLRKTIYGRLAGDPAVMAIPDSFLPIVPKNKLAFRALQVLSFNPSSVTRLNLTQAGKHVSVVSPGSKQQSVRWKMTEPVQASTDEAAITEIITTLSGLRVESWESEASSPRGNYGLETPLAEVEWELDSRGVLGSGSTAAPTSGKLTIGAQKPKSYLFYAAIEGKPGVFTLSPFAVASLMKEVHNRSITDFRLNDLRRAIFDWPGRRLVVESSGDYVSKSRWRVVESSGNQGVESSAIEPFLEALSQLDALRFLQYSGAIPESSGLAKPRLVIQLFVQKGPKLQTILLRVGGDAGESSLVATTSPTAEGPTFVIEAKPPWPDWLKPSQAVDEWPEDVFAK